MPKCIWLSIVITLVSIISAVTIIISKAADDNNNVKGEEIIADQEKIAAQVKIVAQVKMDEAENKEDEDKEKRDIGDSPYQDLTTCKALYNSQSYARDKDYMFMLPGKNGWVFRTRQDLQMNFDLPDESLSLYQKFSNVLKSKGIELVISYIPTRGMVAYEHLPENVDQTEDYDPKIARDNYNVLIKKMQNSGVGFVGTPEPQIGANYFNHADQHWTTKGAQIMAQAVAAYVKDKPFMPAIPKQEYKTSIGEEKIYDGIFGKFIKEVCGFRPQPEKDSIVKTEKVGNENIELSLLGDQTPPQVVLVGTSNSIREEFNSNFEGYLKEYLQTDVYNAAISGGGIDDSLISYLLSERFKKTPPKLLIWELPGYYDLGGDGLEDALRQGIAAVSGDCQKPLASYPKTKIFGKKVTIFNELNTLNIGTGQAYLMINFEKSIAKDFSISIKSIDKKNEKFKFKKRREGNGSAFYYLPKGKDTLLSAITMNVNKTIDGLMVEAKICPLN